jgi:hypothetical protein
MGKAFFFSFERRNKIESSRAIIWIEKRKVISYLIIPNIFNVDILMFFNCSFFEK